MQALELYGHTVLCFDSLPSTNTYLKEHIGTFGDKTAIIADLQTSGRGRRQNVWQADRGMLALSALYKDVADPTFMTVICAVAVCLAFEDVSDLDFGIKWTNDIVCRGRKVCGILCESIIKSSKSVGKYVICGMGLNVNQTAEFFKNAALPNAASLFTLTGNKTDKLSLAGYVLKHISELMRCDHRDILDEYRRRCVTLGREVRLIKDGEELTAFAKSINMNGELICIGKSGEFTVNAGEVRVRGKNGEYV